MPQPNANMNPTISKQLLQTELQASLAFSCYDSNSVLKCGKSEKKQTIINKEYNMYMSSNVPNDDHMSHIKLMLEGRGRFKHLFVEKQIEPSLENNIDNIDSPPPQHILMIPAEVLHCIDGKESIEGKIE